MENNTNEQKQTVEIPLNILYEMLDELNNARIKTSQIGQLANNEQITFMAGQVGQTIDKVGTYLGNEYTKAVAPVKSDAEARFK